MSDRPTITLSGARGEEWERVLGTRILYIRTVSPEILSLANDPDAPCVFLDLDGLTGNQREALIDHFARRSGDNRERVAADVLQRGVPIRLGADAKIDVPPGYQERRKLRNGPDAFDMRFFS